MDYCLWVIPDNGDCLYLEGLEALTNETLATALAAILRQMFGEEPAPTVAIQPLELPHGAKLLIVGAVDGGDGAFHAVLAAGDVTDEQRADINALVDANF
jgi:hypothetical protein